MINNTTTNPDEMETQKLLLNLSSALGAAQRAGLIPQTVPFTNLSKSQIGMQLSAESSAKPTESSPAAIRSSQNVNETAKRNLTSSISNRASVPGRTNRTYYSSSHSLSFVASKSSPLCQASPSTTSGLSTAPQALYDNDPIAPDIVPPLNAAYNVDHDTVYDWKSHNKGSSDIRKPYERVLRIPDPKMARRLMTTGKLGIQLTMREIFNKLFAERCGRPYDRNDPQNLVTPEIVRGSLFFVRFNVYEELKLTYQKGKLTISILSKSHGRSVIDIKRKLESRHKVLKMAVASWAAEMLIKEALRRDKQYNGIKSKQGRQVVSDVQSGSFNVVHDARDNDDDQHITNEVKADITIEDFRNSNNNIPDDNANEISPSPNISPLADMTDTEDRTNNNTQDKQQCRPQPIVNKYQSENFNGEQKPMDNGNRLSKKKRGRSVANEELWRVQYKEAKNKFRKSRNDSRKNSDKVKPRRKLPVRKSKRSRTGNENDAAADFSENEDSSSSD